MLPVLCQHVTDEAALHARMQASLARVQLSLFVPSLLSASNRHRAISMLQGSEVSGQHSTAQAACWRLRSHLVMDVSVTPLTPKLMQMPHNFAQNIDLTVAADAAASVSSSVFTMTSPAVRASRSISDDCVD